MNLYKYLDIQKLNSQLINNYRGTVKLVYKNWNKNHITALDKWLNGDIRYMSNASDILSLGIFATAHHGISLPYEVYLMIGDYIVEYVGVRAGYFVGYYEVNKLYKIKSDLANKLSLLGKEITIEIVEKAIVNNMLEQIY